MWVITDQTQSEHNKPAFGASRPKRRLAGPGLAPVVCRYSRCLEIFRIVAAITLRSDFARVAFPARKDPLILDRSSKSTLKFESQSLSLTLP
jgi:hypothetical protein